MKKPLEEPPALIHLSDRRPTPRELPAFAGEPPPEPAPELAPEEQPFLVATRPVRAFEVGESLLLERLLELARPHLRYFQLGPLIGRVRDPGGLSELELRALESRLGNYSRRVRRMAWLHEPGYPLVVRLHESGVDRGQAGDRGVSLCRGLYLLPDGRLGYVEGLGPWTKRAPGQSALGFTPTGARRVTAQEAVRLFPFSELLGTLRALLWHDRGAPQQPADPEVEARRARFLELVHAYAQLCEDFNQRLWRLGLERD